VILGVSERLQRYSEELERYQREGTVATEQGKRWIDQIRQQQTALNRAQDGE
jgi:hypothetical protein